MGKHSLSNTVKIAKLKETGEITDVQFIHDRFGYGKQGFPADGIATFCALWKDDVPISIGIAYCNPKDHFNRKLGRTKSLGRAIAAFENKCSSEIITNGDATKFLKFIYKIPSLAIYMPDHLQDNINLENMGVVKLKK